MPISEVDIVQIREVETRWMKLRVQGLGFQVKGKGVVVSGIRR